MTAEKKKALLILSETKNPTCDVEEQVKFALENLGYELAVKNTNNSFRTIISLVIKSNLIIFDLQDDSSTTHYLLGVCHAIGNNVLITIPNTNPNEYHEDIIEKAMFYEPIDIKLYAKLKKEIPKIEKHLFQIETNQNAEYANIVQNSGKMYFDHRKRMESQLRSLNSEIERAKKFSEIIKEEFHPTNNDSVAMAVVDHISEIRDRSFNRPTIISICGSGAIGKSRFADTLATKIKESLGIEASILHTDCYMNSRATRIMKNKVGFDRQANDLIQLENDVKTLMIDKRKILVPPYSHATGEHGPPETVAPSEILIIEGIYSFHPPIQNLAKTVSHIKYYLYAEKTKAKELKFISDILVRNHSIYKALKHAVPEYCAYSTHILPYMRLADYIIMVEDYWEYRMPYIAHLHETPVDTDEFE